MFCSKCGKEISDNSDFCKYCGANLNDDSKDISKNEKKKKSSSVDHKKKKKIAIVVSIVVVIALIVIVAICCINAVNSEKEKAYNEGVSYIASNNLGDAQDSFEKAGDYKDSKIYLASVSAANKLYNQNAPDEALSTLTDMLNSGDNRDNITKYPDRESSQLTSFIAGEVYFSKQNYSEADVYYSYLPLTYTALGKSCYEKRAKIALVGSWNVHEKAQFGDDAGTHNGEVDYVNKYLIDGTYTHPGYGKRSTSDGSTIFWNDPINGFWKVDTSFNGSDGIYHYLWDEETKAALNDKTLTWSIKETKGNSTSSYEFSATKAEFGNY